MTRAAAVAESAGRVLVLGAINVDLVVAAERLPAPGETVVGPSLATHGGGKGANAAVAAARAGASVRLLGAVGDDGNGAGALRELEAEGVDCEGVARLAGIATGAALIVVDPAGENQIAVAGGANLQLHPALVRDRLSAALPQVDCLLVSTEIPGKVAAAAVAAAAEAGVTCVLNPAPPVPELAAVLEGGPLLTPNAGELRALLALLGEAAGDDPAENARRLHARTGAAVIVTLGSGGALVIGAGGAAAPVAPAAAEVRDTTGAGDTFNGVLAARLAAGDPLDAAAIAANAAAALSVAHAGARSGMPRAGAIAAAADRETG